MLAILTISLLLTQSPFTEVLQTPIWGGQQIKGLVTLNTDGQRTPKRFVLRIPAKWNGALVIGAHGGSGGDAVDRSGKKYATSETALDDVIGAYAFEHGFAYASVDRDGHNSVFLTMEFTSVAEAEVERLTGRRMGRTYIVGLSAGGRIARLIAERNESPFDGAIIIAGGGGDVITGMDRQQRMAALWPLIDPRAHYGLSNSDSRIIRYAEAVGTPVAARRLWPYTGASAVAAAARPPGTVENAAAKPSIPVIEVVGTWDDLVIREVRAYAQRVEPKDRHRLYQVEGVWHMSGDDDGVQGFQFAAESRMKLDKDVADAMGEGPSYLPIVRQAFGYLVDWVKEGKTPPSSQTVQPNARLR